jgi:hypothetical protein
VAGPRRPSDHSARPGARLKVGSFTVRASADQARRWVRVARYLGYRSVSAWLHELAEEQALRVEETIRQE